MIKLAIPFFLVLFGKTYSQNQDNFVLKSNDLGDFFSPKFIYDKYNCGGENLSPELHWDNAPEGTKSYAITLFDPDAPTGHGWWHWLIFNIPVNITHLATGAGSKYPELLPPNAIQSVNDYGEIGYGGPCPPKGNGPHRYIFTIYALNTSQINLSSGTAPEIVNKEIKKHSIAHASFLSFYKR